MSKGAIKSTLENASAALKAALRHPKELLLSSLCDAMFFFAYGFISWPLHRKLAEYIAIIGSALSEGAASLTRGESASIGAIIANDPMAVSYMNKILILYVMLAFTAYFVYTFFHSVSWKLSLGISGRKIGMYEFIRKFSAASAIWLIAFIAYYLVDFFADLRQAAMNALRADASNTIGVIASLMLIAILYFGILSYSLMAKAGAIEAVKKSLVLGVKNAKMIAPSFALIAAVYLIIDYILGIIGGASFYAMLAVGIFTMIPAMTWARVLMISAAEKAESQK